MSRVALYGVVKVKVRVQAESSWQRDAVPNLLERNEISSRRKQLLLVVGAEGDVEGQVQGWVEEKIFEERKGEISGREGKIENVL